MTVTRTDLRAGLLLCITLTAAPLTHAADCAALAGLTLPDVQLEITRAEAVPAGPAPETPFGSSHDGDIPAHCRVDGVIDRRIGHAGRPYGIGFALALPANWNGRFLFQGGGGLNGTVRPPLGAQASGDTPALARGFAVASTDSGHQSEGPFDGRFFEDQEATLNFLYQAIGKVTDVARAIVREHYSQSAAHSYYVGCSTGGREAMLMSQRYPRHFDGVVAGAPAIRTNLSNLAMRWMSTAFNAIAPLDDDGLPLGEHAFSGTDRELIVGALLTACDALDGVEDGMIFNTRDCGFDPATLTCDGEKTDQCLTAAQVNALHTALSGPVDSTGHQVYPGFLYDTGIDAPGPIPGILRAGQSPVGPPNRDVEMDVDREAREAADAAAAVGNSTWTQLSTFAGNGGRLIFYHGVSDPWFSALDTVEYYEAMAAANGGVDAVRQWSRLFLVPGMGHCGGGAALDRFDMLDAVVDWVENDRAPAAVTATGAAFPGRSRPLCPYPTHAHYDGHGDSEDAASFICR